MLEDESFSLEYITPEQAKSVLNALIAADTEFTVSIGQLSSSLLLLLEPAAQYGLNRVILCDFDRSRLEGEIATLRKIGVRILVQVTCQEDAELAEQLGADGLVVKGNESGGRVGEESTFILLQPFSVHNWGAGFRKIDWPGFAGSAVDGLGEGATGDRRGGLGEMRGGRASPSFVADC